MREDGLAGLNLQAPKRHRPPPLLLRTVWVYLRENYFVVLIAAVLLWIVGAPILYLLRMSLQTGTPADPGNLTIQNYVNVYQSPYTFETLLNTFIFAIGATVISLGLAAIFAWLVERTDMPGRSLIWIVMLLPLAMPGMLVSMGWILLASPDTGLINLPLQALFRIDSGPFDIFTLEGMVFVEGIRGGTTLFLLMVAAYRVMDPALEEAAAISGSGPFKTLRRVTLGLMLPALFGAGMYGLLGNLDDFDTPLLLGLPGDVFVLPTLIFFTAQVTGSPNWGLAAAYASLFLIISIVLVIVYHWFVTRRANRYATITGKGYRPRRVALGRWRYLGFTIVICYSLLAIVLPLLVLIWASLLPGVYQLPSIEMLGRVSLENYTTLFADSSILDAAFNTLRLAVLTATATMILAYLVSWLVIRLRVRGRAILDGISFIPLAIPSVAIGLAMIVFYLHPSLQWLGIYGSMVVIVFALMSRYLAYGTRTSNAAMTQISAELEDASALSGANRLKTFLRITTPLLLPAFIAGWLWVFAHASRTLTIPLLLTTPRNEFLVTKLWNLWNSDADYPMAATLAVVMILALGILIFLVRHIFTRGYTAD